MSVVTFGPRITPDGSPPTRSAIAWRQDLDRLQRIPVVTAAAFVNNLPLSGATTTLSFQKGGTMVEARTVSSQYFTAMGIPLVEGRFFTEPRRASRRASSSTNPLRARNFRAATRSASIWTATKDPAPVRKIIGVVKDSSMAKYDDPVKPEEYVSYQQVLFGTFLSTFVIRTSGDPLNLAETLRQEVWAVDPDQPVVKVETMQDVVADSIWRPRVSAWMFSVLARSHWY